MAKSKGKAGGPEVVDIKSNEELEQGGEQTQELRDQEWILLARDTRTPFFDALQDVPEGGWDKCSIYLYRLDPAVSNKQGDKKYIAVYGSPITEEGIKQEHGGGKYHAYLKYGKETLRNHRFSIEGQPVFIEGQTLRGAAAAPGAPGGGAQQSDLANVVRQVIDATKGDQTAANAGIEVLKSAMKDGLALNKTILESQIGSATGNKVGDKVLDMILPRLLDQKQQELPPIITKFLEAAIGLVKNPREQAPAQTNPMEQLSFVKDLLGVDSIKDLFDQGRRATEQPFWVPLLANAIEKLPGLFHEYAEMQERAFQRALIVHQARAGTAIELGAPGPQAPMVRVDAMPMPAAPGETAEQRAERMVGTIVEAICRAWDEGYPGDVAGAHLKIGYPQLVEQLKPLLVDPVQLSAFIASIPALAERATDAEWPEFQADLIAEINQVPLPAGAEASPLAQTDQVTAGAPAAESRGAPATAKKRKTNGHAA